MLERRRHDQIYAALNMHPVAKASQLNFTPKLQSIIICLTAIIFLLLITVATGMALEWKKAIGPRPWSFPRDHGAHPEYRTEWWYFTGNLQDNSGKKYGYQLTFFRQGLTPVASRPDNAWSIRDIYLAHFAIVDKSNAKFWHYDQASRSGPGLAGARIGALDVWTLTWSAKMTGNTIHLTARRDETELELDLSPRKAKIFHGEKGLSSKGPNPGQASYYYSFTDLAAKGTIRTPFMQQRIEVTGISWFDQEFGSNVLNVDQVGWDWFGIHLSDGRDIMLFQLRKKDGSIEPTSSGTIIEKNGSSRQLQQSEIILNVLNRWKSRRSGYTYPSQWQIRIPTAGLDIIFTPIVADQELITEASTGVTYWEGAVTGTGTAQGKAITIEGYAELTGYAGSMGRIF